MLNLWPHQAPCLVIGHRGAMGYAPENTLVSFEEGVRRGADFIEMDVQLSADNEVVVMHDTSVDRTTDGSGFVREGGRSDALRNPWEPAELLPSSRSSRALSPYCRKDPPALRRPALPRRPLLRPTANK
jgi:glycerophosphoryl diester phosphodiesterase